MHKSEVTLAMEEVAKARKAWSLAQSKFNSEVEMLMARLLNEAAVQKMSVPDVSAATGLTNTKVRMLMRKHGLNPKTGRNLLAAKAAEALAENAELMGVEPHEFDLTSPLAYLPMGRDLRKFLETNKMDAADLDAIESHEVEHLTEVFKRGWHEADEAGMEGSRTLRGILAVLDAQKQPVSA